MGSKHKRLVFKVKRDLGRRKLLARSSTSRHRSPLIISLVIHLVLGLGGFTYWFVAENRGEKRSPLNLLVALAKPQEKVQIPKAPSARPLPRSVIDDALSFRAPRLMVQARPSDPGCCGGHATACVASLEVDALGAVTRAGLVASSGCRRFDAAALTAARDSACAPALRGGRPVAGVLDQVAFSAK